MRFSPNSRFVLASSLDGRLRLWDFLLGRPLKTYSGHDNLSLCCAAAFHAPTCAEEEAAAADGSAAAASSSSSSSSLSSSSPSATSAAPAPRIVAGAEDGRVHVWDVNSRSSLGTFHAGTAGEPVLGLDAHPHEDALVTGVSSNGSECAVRMWQPAR